MTEDSIDISSSQEELLLHSSLLLNPLPPPSTPTPPDGLFAPSSNELPPSASSSPNQQPPIRMVSLSDSPDDKVEDEDEFHSIDHATDDTFDTARMDEDTVVPETEPPMEKGESPRHKSTAKGRRPPRRMNRWRVSFRKSPAGKKPPEEEEDDRDRSADDDPFKQFRYVKPAEVKEAAAGASRKLPASMRVESPAKKPREQEEGEDRHGLTMTMLSCLEEGWRCGGEDDPRFPADIFDVVRLLVGKRVRGPEEDVDILEVARGKGIRFTPPKWHRPGGYNADCEVTEK